MLCRYLETIRQCNGTGGAVHRYDLVWRGATGALGRAVNCHGKSSV